jgi:hypothetical protein
MGSIRLDEAKLLRWQEKHPKLIPIPKLFIAAAGAKSFETG